ncbi:MAG: methylamine utilization protein [Thalassolituus maritimus]|nr:MAG: methylamine utilization protein [Thalassolituus maritimus]
MNDKLGGFFVRALVLSFCLLIVFRASAQEYRIKITDMAGQPMEHAVVSIRTDSPAPVAKTIALMDQIDRKFAPRVLTVNQNDLVSFPNSDNIRHHVYSFSAPKVFEIKLYADVPEAPIEFAEPGIVVLGCNIHDDMIGYIYVTPPEFVSAVTDSLGESVIESSGDITEVRIWHERLSAVETDQITLTAQGLQNYQSGDSDYLIAINPELPPVETKASSHNHGGFGNGMRR